MKTISGTLKAHLLQDVTTICTCWLITRTDGKVFAFTDHDADLTIGGVDYESASGYVRTAMKSSQTLAVDNMDISGILIDVNGIPELDLKKGLFDYASVQIFTVNWADLTQGIMRMRNGTFGEVTVTTEGVFTTEIRGLTQFLTQNFGRTYSAFCDADLGDTRCKVSPVPPYTGTATVTSVIQPTKEFQSTSITYPPYAQTQAATIFFSIEVAEDAAIAIGDGTNTLSIVWPCNYDAKDSANFVVTAINNAHAAGTFQGTAVVVDTSGVSITLTAPSSTATITSVGMTAVIYSYADGALNGGLITWLTGNNAGMAMEIKTYTQTTEDILLWLAMPFAIQVGDTFTYAPGCDKTRETCCNKFNNILNFRGFPDIPGMDQYLYYPDAS